MNECLACFHAPPAHSCNQMWLAPLMPRVVWSVVQYRICVVHSSGSCCLQEASLVDMLSAAFSLGLPRGWQLTPEREPSLRRFFHSTCLYNVLLLERLAISVRLRALADERVCAFKL